MPVEYAYRVSAWWTSGRTGLAKCESSPSTIHFSDAPEMGGLENRWAPEQLLLCALAGCFTTTFHEVACGARFGYTDLEVEVEGSVRRNHNAGRDFSEILLRPRLTVPSEDQREVGLELLRQAKEACMISRAITVPQTLEPSVVTLKVPVGGWNNQDATVKLEA